MVTHQASIGHINLIILTLYIEIDIWIEYV